MKKAIQLLLVISITTYGFGQQGKDHYKVGTLELFSLDDDEYVFSFTNDSQGLYFDSIIYETPPRFRARILNTTNDTIFNHYKERDSRIYWLRENGSYDTILPGQEMILRGLTPGGRFLGIINSPIYLNFQIKDSVYNNNVLVWGSIYPANRITAIDSLSDLNKSAQSIELKSKKLLSKNRISRM